MTDGVLIVRGGGYFPRDEPYVVNIRDATAVSVAEPQGTSTQAGLWKILASAKCVQG